MAMFARSPAVSASRPSGLIDPHHPAEYPVLLGDTFHDAETSFPGSLSMRYNWKTQKPSSITRTHLKKGKSSPEDSYEVVVEDRLHKDHPYKYAGHVSGKSAGGNEEDGDSSPDQSLALIWDPAKSGFRLEPITARMDFNLTSAPDQSQREVNAHRKLRVADSKESASEQEAAVGPDLQSSGSDSDPDTSNPYDFRHFLAEARENAINGNSGAGSRTPIPGSRTPVPGGKTPIPGSHTPLHGLPSPALGANKSTPKFHATSSSSAITKKRKLDRPTPSQKPKNNSPSRKHAPSAQALSFERIIDSDDELSQPTKSTTSHRKHLTALNSPTSKHRPSSPHLIVSDASAALEIDLGSPPPPSKYTQRKRPLVNPDAFHRSHANTPVIAQPEDAETDVDMLDADVEELALGSPRSGAPSRGISVARIEKGDDMEEEEDDDDLAAELEAALEEEAEEGEGVGLGISAAKEDESEVSEEE
jgi:hypothetical protein